MMIERVICPWAGNDPLYRDYHDNEWGRPLHDERRLFELLVLEGMQAGLSWITILRKRPALRAAFAGFDPQLVARFDDEQIEQLLANPHIIRNRLKVKSAVSNAEAFLTTAREAGSFDRYLWHWVDNQPIVNTWVDVADIPAVTPLAEAISRDLKKRGFSFVGPTICYALMQSAGLVCDHLISCDCHPAHRRGGQEADSPQRAGRIDA
jgi:DNA-3-methyladenine glycosylase I